MKWHRYIIPIVGVLLGIGIITYTLWDNTEEQVTQYDIQIENLINENQELTHANYMLDSTLTKLEHRADSLVLLIKEVKNNTVIIKKRRNEKSIRITSFSNDELYEYFAKFETQKDTVR